MAGRRVLILGAGGQLGRKVAEVFRKGHWCTIGADTHSKPETEHVIPVHNGVPLEVQHRDLTTEVERVLAGCKLDAILNVAGGFAMGAASDEGVVAAMRIMTESSLYSSVMAARTASTLLRPGGLLVLPGAAAALGPTAWSLPYGASKAAVHHLVRSLADAESAGLPPGAKTVGLAPQVLDTPQNREAMPDADTGSWATLEEVAKKLEAWCSDPGDLQSGMVYVVQKEGGRAARFEPCQPL